MDIVIHNEKKLRDIQAEFQKRFSFLKIEFFHPKSSGDGYTVKDMIDPDKRVEEVATKKSSQSLHITGIMTVLELEKHGREILGIHVEVFRKSGKIWLKTSTTDNWTLDVQNKEAREAELNKYEKPEHTDYHEQE